MIDMSEEAVLDFKKKNRQNISLNNISDHYNRIIRLLNFQAVRAYKQGEGNGKWHCKCEVSDNVRVYIIFPFLGEAVSTYLRIKIVSNSSGLEQIEEDIKRRLAKDGFRRTYF